MVKCVWWKGCWMARSAGLFSDADTLPAQQAAAVELLAGIDLGLGVGHVFVGAREERFAARMRPWRSGSAVLPQKIWQRILDRLQAFCERQLRTAVERRVELGANGRGEPIAQRRRQRVGLAESFFGRGLNLAGALGERGWLGRRCGSVSAHLLLSRRRKRSGSLAWRVDNGSAVVRVFGRSAGAVIALIWEPPQEKEVGTKPANSSRGALAK